MADILLVEDKDSLRRVLRLTSENAGYSVAETVDTRAAINEIADSRHPLVLTDLRMRNGSGLDVLHAARSAGADAPVMVMTASALSMKACWRQTMAIAATVRRRSRCQF